MSSAQHLWRNNPGLWPAGKQAVHLLVARTASGSSVRFASAFAAAYQRWCAAASIINTHLDTHLV